MKLFKRYTFKKFPSLRGGRVSGRGGKKDGWRKNQNLAWGKAVI